MVESMKMCKIFDVEQNSIVTEKVMSRHWLNFEATLVIPVAINKNIKPHISGRDFCRDMLSFCCNKVGAKMGHTRRILSRHVVVLP